MAFQYGVLQVMKSIFLKLMFQKRTVRFGFLKEATFILRAPVRKNQTYRGKGGKFDFFHILMLDRLGYN